MRRTITALAVLAVGTLAPLAASAADHKDGPAATADPASDITDLFAWMSADGAKVNLVLDVFPAATTASKFSNTTKYAFRTTSYAAFPGSAVDKTNVVCTFDATQKISCWAVDKDGKTLDYLAPTDASNSAGVMSSGGKMKVFAGLRDDPFFFNLTGFKTVAKYVHDNAASLGTPDAAGCIAVNTATSMAARQLLSTGKDDFAGLNVLSIVVQIDKTLLTSKPDTNPVIGVWASTNK